MDVVLVDVGPKKFKVIQAIQAVTGARLKDTVALVDAGQDPVVGRGLDLSAAEMLKARLEEAGGTVRFQPASGVPAPPGQPGSPPAPPETPEIRPDIKSAMARMNVTFGGRRELKKLDEHLWHDELVEEMTTGAYGGGLGLVLLTDRRLLFFRDGWVSRTSEDFPRDKISSVQFSSGMVLGKITIFASGNRAEIENVNKADGKRIVDNIRARVSSPAGPTPQPHHPPQPVPPPPSPPPAKPADDPLAQLKKLGELRDAGVVTPEEFEAKKAELLSRL